MENLNELIRNHTEYRKIKDEKYNSDSKDRLSKILKKKVITTMIGSLSSIEKHFGFCGKVIQKILQTNKKKY